VSEASTETCGVVYVAIGERFAGLARNAAQSLRQHMPDANITLVTHAPVDDPLFDNVLLLDSASYSPADKIRGIQLSPYDRTIYLDCDTYISDDISEMFTLLDRFDIGAAHKNRRYYFPIKEINEKVPFSFPQYNGGVVVVKAGKGQQVIDAWLELYLRYEKRVKELMGDEYRRNTPDEASFREVLYFSDARIATLTPEYNSHFRMFGGYHDRKVKVVHGKHKDLPGIERLLNETIEKRVFVYDENRDTLRVYHQKQFGLLKTVITSLQTRGVGGSIKAALKKIGLYRGDLNGDD